MIIGKIIISISLFIQVLLGLLFYVKQNQQHKLGGPISEAKTAWLFFALYIYFILPVIMYFLLGNKLTIDIKNTLATFIILIYSRSVIQPILMYGLKIWTPPIGISYNIFCFLFLTAKIVLIAISTYPFVSSIYDSQILGLLCIVQATLLTDSFYAWAFYKIVGMATQGEKAIWYASKENPAFRQINAVTFNFNVMFFLILTWWLIRTFIYL